MMHKSLVPRRNAVLLAVLMAAGSVTAAGEDGIFAIFDTTMGSFTCRLDHVRAPRTTANFISLAAGTRGWADPATGGVVAEPYYDVYEDPPYTLQGEFILGP